jgi:glutathione S-transferase
MVATPPGRFPKTMMKLYGVPLSQPFRSVAWTLLQLKLPFRVELAIPGMTSKVGTKHENFRNLTPHRSTQVPLLVYEDDDAGESSSSSPVVLTESPAIMAHLCERFGPITNSTLSTTLYPASGSVAKAKVDSYLHWHHSNTRLLARLFGPKVLVGPYSNLTLSEKDHAKFRTVLQQLDSGWLQKTDTSDGGGGNPVCYIGGLDHPTIADILAYGELSTVTMTNLLELSPEEYPSLHAWMHQMSQLPHHDLVHQSLTTLGDLSTAGDEDSANNSISKRLGAATKAGLQGIADAQATYSGQISSKL